MKLYFLISLFVINLVSASDNHVCPDGWIRGPNICLRFSEKGSLRDTIVDCMNKERILETPVVGLIRVGQLRKLKAIESRRLDRTYRKIRVDAFKDMDLIWREYSTGQRISFTAFPTFNPIDGIPGQSLIYDMKAKTLELALEGETRFHGLCYSLKRPDHLNEQCYNLGEENECSDHGDCVNGVCVCDSGFTGTKCQGVGTVAKRYAEGKDKTAVKDCQKLTRMDGSSNCFMVDSEGLSYEAAVESCISKGYKLAEVHDVAVQNHLRMMSLPFKAAWIPLTDLDGDSQFSWASGTPIDYNNWAVAPTSSDRATAAPLPCAMLDPTQEFKWVDVTCDSKADILGICQVY